MTLLQNLLEENIMVRFRQFLYEAKPGTKFAFECVCDLGTRTYSFEFDEPYEQEDGQLCYDYFIVITDTAFPEQDDCIQTCDGYVRTQVSGLVIVFNAFTGWCEYVTDRDYRYVRAVENGEEVARVRMELIQ